MTRGDNKCSDGIRKHQQYTRTSGNKTEMPVHRTGQKKFRFSMDEYYVETDRITNFKYSS